VLFSLPNSGRGIRSRGGTIDRAIENHDGRISVPGTLVLKAIARAGRTAMINGHDGYGIRIQGVVFIPSYPAGEVITLPVVEPMI